ncbi:MAG TPA: sigma-70 family RNA polymerase sigma factor [Thermoanaerobaculia bacterium]
MRLVTTPIDSSDEELMRQIASGREEAVGPLYARYAPILFGMAARALDRPAAEEIVQDVFVAVWKNAGAFDASRGPVRPWLLQIAHYRIANALRGRSRRPRAEPDPDGQRLSGLADPAPDPSELAWSEYRRAALRRALAELPPPQRQALGLSFFEDLSHGEMASVLGLPLGTAKARVRSGLAGLRRRLAPLVAVLAFLALLAGIGVLVRDGRRALGTDERALAMLTSSDAQALRLTAAPGTSPQTHGVYRFRAGTPTVVLTLSNFPAAPAARTYQAWALLGGRWTSVGTARPDSSGRARLIAEGPAFALRPEALEVRLEPEAGSVAPAGQVVIGWTGS